MLNKFLSLALTFITLSTLSAAAPTPKIQGTLNIKPEKIQPGTPIEFSIHLENKGDAPTPEGEVFVRFALIKPIANNAKGILFETEKEKIPSIAPGKELHVVFKSSHHLPTVIDFVREDWLLHEYQGVLLVNGKETVITTLPLTCSVHYYPVFKQKTPTVEIR